MSYWTLESPLTDTPKRNTIIPDGTMKMIFHYGDLYWHHPEEQESFIQPRCFLIGQLTKPYIVEPIGVTGTFIVRFRPHGFTPFTKFPIRNMINTPVPLDQLFENEGTELAESILKANCVDERIEIIESFLFKKLKETEVIDRIVKLAIETINDTKGQISVSELSEFNNLSRRMLSRKFSSNVGLSPKQLSKIIRLQSTLSILLTQDISKLTDIAYENEYYDQAHFIKDFKEFTGVTPKEFYGDSLKMSLIFENLE